MALMAPIRAFKAPTQRRNVPIHLGVIGPLLAPRKGLSFGELRDESLNPGLASTHPDRHPHGGSDEEYGAGHSKPRVARAVIDQEDSQCGEQAEQQGPTHAMC